MNDVVLICEIKELKFEENVNDSTIIIRINFRVDNKIVWTTIISDVVLHTRNIA
jgi:hypothetical protein